MCIIHTCDAGGCVPTPPHCLCHLIQLPFSEFFLTNRGYMQDNQTLLPRSSLSSVGLLLVDKVVGPFELELQTIKAVRRMTTRTFNRDVIVAVKQ